MSAYTFHGAYGRVKCFHCGKRHRQGNTCPRLERKLCEKCGQEPPMRRVRCHRCGRLICHVCRVYDFGKHWCSDFAGRTPADCKEAERVSHRSK